LDSVRNPAHALKCEMASEVLRSSGKLRLGVMGWSMLPTVMPGDTLVIDRVEDNAVSEGDIVLFEREGRLCAHRVVSKNILASFGIVTRGDAMPHADPPVNKHEFLGRVSYVIRNEKYVEVSRSMSLAERAIAALVRRSETAARVVVSVHGMRQTSQVPA
jgi:signal peptidase I